MSYILDALKKSNRERNGEKSNDLHIVRNPSTMPSRPGFTISGTAGLILLVCVLLFVGFVFLYNSIKNDSVAFQGEGKTQIVIAKKVDFMASFDDLDRSVSRGSSVVVVADSPYAKKYIRQEKRKKILLGSELQKAEAVQPVPRALPNRFDLPAVLQKELPELRFAGHTYAEDPGQRLIIINNEIRREGDRLDKDTRLVEIVWEGVILEYKGILFEQKLNL